MAKKRTRGTGSVYKRGRNWFVKYYVNGKPFREPTGSTEKRDADALLKQRLGEIATGVHAGISTIKVGALLDMCVADYIEHEKRDLVGVKIRIKAHIRPLIGHIRAAGFGSEDIKHYIKLRREGRCCEKCRAKGKGAKNATINRELSTIRHSFKLAAQMDPPRVVRVPHFPKLEESNEREGIVTREQYDCLKRNLPAHAALALAIGYHTGMRRGLIMSLRWEWVDLAANVIRIPAAKNATKKQPRVVPIYGDMRPMLEMAREVAKSPYVIEFRGAKVFKIQVSWKRACKACGIDGVLFHDLRRTAATNALLAGISQVDIMEMCGWRTVTMLKRYAQGLETRAQDTGRKMEAFLDRQAEKIPSIKTMQ
jgi:integrase